MPRGIKELVWEKDVIITEAGDTPYPLHIKLFKSRVVIEDDEGNRIAIDKRKGKIAIQRKGRVVWHMG